MNKPPASMHTSGQALERLTDGNKRRGVSTRIRSCQTLERRTDLYGCEHPFATIWRYKDSRVPPELIVERELDDLSAIRIAGDTLDDMISGSIE